MKLTIASSELLKGLLDVAKAIPSKTPLPILENFLFDLRSKGFFQAVWAMVKLHFQVFFPIRNNG